MRGKIWPMLVGIFVCFLFLAFQAKGIYGGDSGDLVSAAVTSGVPHPPGYPLYTLLGYLVSHLPFATPAWRVSLISSIPHALVVIFIMLMIKKLTANFYAALVAGVALLGNYLFFLYSVTPEVFALLDLFIILLIYTLFCWLKIRQNYLLYLASFILGVSLAHHQVILFIAPSLIYLLLFKINKEKFSSRQTRQARTLCLGCFLTLLSGLLFYLYIPLAARGNSIINWDRAVNLENFLRLLTRSDYGTFKSGGFYGEMLIQRLLSVKLYFKLLLLDISWVGIILSLGGVIFLWKKNRVFLLFLLLAILSFGPVFFFYASFPMASRFTLGTFERFLLPSYTIFYIFIGCGVALVFLQVSQLRVLRSRMAKNLVNLGLMIVLTIYPLSVLGMTLWRFWGIWEDKTAQYLGQDILDSVRSDSILLLSRDTPLFITQYVRYALNYRSDVILLQQSRLSVEDYRYTFSKIFPSLSLPNQSDDDFTSLFIKTNREKHDIYTNNPVKVEENWLWVPYGLIYKLMHVSQIASIEKVYEDNQTLWQNYHDPRVGILKRYNHLMLSDLRDVYANSRIELGKRLLRAGLLAQAKEQFGQAIALDGDSTLPEAYTFLGLTELFDKNCDRAQEAFKKAQSVSLVRDKQFKLYEAVTWRDCVQDQEKAKKFLEEYQNMLDSEQTPLEKL